MAMSDYPEDLSQRIVSVVEGGMSKAQAARIFSASLSSVKRYVKKADHGESLAPKKRPGSAPKLDEKMGRLIAADLEERSYATLRERCDYIEAITGLSVSRSTMCRAIARRTCSTRKKGGELPPSATSSRGWPGG
jgi:transposase